MPVLLVHPFGRTYPRCSMQCAPLQAGADEVQREALTNMLIYDLIWVMRICGTMWQCQEWYARMTVSIADSWRCSVSCCIQNNLPGRSYWHICLYLRQPHLCNRLRNTPWAESVSNSIESEHLDHQLYWSDARHAACWAGSSSWGTLLPQSETPQSV